MGLKEQRTYGGVQASPAHGDRFAPIRPKDASKLIPKKHLYMKGYINRSTFRAKGHPGIHGTEAHKVEGRCPCTRK